MNYTVAGKVNLREKWEDNIMEILEKAGYILILEQDFEDEREYIIAMAGKG